MASSKRLTAAVSGNGQDGIVLAPAVIARDGDFDSASHTRDLRPNRVLTVDTDASGADTFTLSFTLDPDPDGTFKGTVDADGVFTTAAIDDDAVAATIQAAIRSALPGTDLTVVTGDAPGPFTITFDPYFWPRRYPRVIGTGTGCTVTVENAALSAQSPDSAIDAIGESHFVSPTDSILAPTIGTATVTGGTDEVQTLDYSAGTDGGTFQLRYKNGIGGTLDFDASWDEVQAVVDAIFDDSLGPELSSADSPTVAGRGTSDVQTLELNDIAAADTYKLTFNGHESALITYAVDSSAAILAALEGLVDFVPGDILSVTSTDDDTYPITFDPSLGDVGAITITTQTGFTATGVTHTATGVQDGFTFTYENGNLAGRPVPLIALEDDSLDDGGVLEPATITASTPGVLGSVSIAYTENGGGDNVVATVVFDDTGECFDLQVDAATPAVFDGLIPGDYTAVFRTDEDDRVSKAASAAFSVTSS